MEACKDKKADKRRDSDNRGKLPEKIISGNKIRVISKWTSLEDRIKKSLMHYINAYDATYTHIAELKGLTLITGDLGMYANAKNVIGIYVLHIDEFLDSVFR